MTRTTLQIVFWQVLLIVVLEGLSFAEHPTTKIQQKRLERLAQSLTYLPSNVSDIRYLSKDIQNEILYYPNHIHVARTGLQSVSARTRGLSVALCLWFGDSSVLQDIVASLEDNQKTIPAVRNPAWGFYPGYSPKTTEQSVREVAVKMLTRRLGTIYGKQLSSSQAYEEFLKTGGIASTWPSEWVSRFRNYRALGLSEDSLYKEMQSMAPHAKALCLLNVMAYLPEARPGVKPLDILRSVSKDKWKRFLAGKWRLPGMTLRTGPNSKDQMDARRVLLRYASQLLASTDAQWLYDATDRKEWVYPYYIVAASKLDPAKGVGWLKKEISAEQDRMNQCLMLETLWSIAGEKEQRYIVDHFYEASKPAYSPGLQIDLIRKLAKSEGKKAVPLFRAIILDKRFSTLGWGATRALAQQAKLILGQETKESKRYLRVQHALGLSTYESDPKRRSNHLVDTKHVEMQTNSFKGYLQAAVRAKGNTE